MIDRIRVGWFCGGMKQLSILIALLISLGFSSVCWGNILKIDNHKELRIVVEDIGDNVVGITTDKVSTMTKLRLMANNIKPSGALSRYLYIMVIPVDIIVAGEKLGSAFTIHINLARESSEFGVFVQDSTQAVSSSLTLSLGDLPLFERVFNNLLDGFILKYLEANME